MMVEAREEVIECVDYHRGQDITKGKRTKRPRAPSPLALTMAYSSSEDRASTVSQGGGMFNNVSSDNISSSCIGVDSSIDRAVEGPGIEDEDMANCLILLARGERVKPPSPWELGAATTSRSKVSGVDSYQCKTCNRCFPSFQALGGHRASHKKPKVIMNGSGDHDKKIQLAMTSLPTGGADRSLFVELSLQMPMSGQMMPTQSGKKPKVHECSICRTEFNSGQALGGHMRRHRTIISAPPTANIGVNGSTSSISFEAQDQAGKNSRNILHFDLNLPAPEDRESKYSSLTISKERVLIFSASPLVDCYY